MSCFNIINFLIYKISYFKNDDFLNFKFQNFELLKLKIFISINI